MPRQVAAAIGIIALILALAWIALHTDRTNATATIQPGPPSADLPAGASDPPTAPDRLPPTPATRAAIQVSPGVPDDGSSPPPPRRMIVRGRVLDRDARPIEHATIRCRWGQSTTRVETTADGRFTVPIVEHRGLGVPCSITVVAVSPGEREAHTEAIDLDEFETERDLGDLFLDHPAAAVAIEVRQRGRAVPGARVFLGSETLSAQVDEFTADRAGQLRTHPLGAGPYRVLAVGPDGERGATSFRVPLVERALVVIELQGLRDVAVQVVDRATGEPIVGATVFAVDQMRFGDRNWQWDPWFGRDDAWPVSGADGRVLLTRMPATAPFVVAATASGYSTVEHASTTLVSPDVTDVMVELPREETLEWPLDTPSQALVPDGTPISAAVFRDPTAMVMRPIEMTATVNGGVVRVEHGDGTAQVIVLEAANGARAQTTYRARGEPLAFHQTGAALVRVVDPSGQGIAGLAIQLESKFHLVPPPRGTTDAGGRVRIAGLARGTWEIGALSTEHPYRTAEPIGQIEIDAAESAVEVVMGAAVHVNVQFIVDGLRRLPPGLDLEPSNSVLVQATERRAEGIVEMVLLPRPGASAISCEVAGVGFRPTSAEFDPAIAHHRIKVEIVTDAAAMVPVLPPADGIFTLTVDRFVAHLDRWIPEPAAIQETDAPNTRLIDQLPPGRFRLRDTQSGTTSAPFEVGAVKTLRLQPFDLSAVVPLPVEIDGAEESRDGLTIEWRSSGAEPVAITLKATGGGCVPREHPPRQIVIRARADQSFVFHATHASRRIAPAFAELRTSRPPPSILVRIDDPE